MKSQRKREHTVAVENDVHHCFGSAERCREKQDERAQNETMFGYIYGQTLKP